ncbi:MAG: shikimate dehydrogenase family protein [Gemmatimonadaceae bacterium]
MNRPTRLVLLGSPVAHSLSPTFQNAALDIAGLPLRYEALDVAPAELDAVLERLALEGAAGNVTAPHKVAVHDRCTALTPAARRAGAVNTFWFDEGTMHGDNTDVGGFRGAVAELLDGEPLPRIVTLLGAGGAAAGVCTAAEQWGATSVRVVARSRGSAHRLAARFPGLVAVADAIDEFADEPRASGASKKASTRALVVNATPLGLVENDPLPADISSLPAGAFVLDLVYRRGETRFVQAARRAGHRAADGLTMLLEQGALSFERWFGFAPDRDAMRRSLS